MSAAYAPLSWLTWLAERDELSMPETSSTTDAEEPAPQVPAPQSRHMSALIAWGERLHLPAPHQVHCVMPKDPPQDPLGQSSQDEAPVTLL